MSPDWADYTYKTLKSGNFITGDDASGNQIAPNPTYGQVKLYQPPMSMRLGMEVNF